MAAFSRLERSKTAASASASAGRAPKSPRGISSGDALEQDNKELF